MAILTGSFPLQNGVTSYSLAFPSPFPPGETPVAMVSVRNSTDPSPVLIGPHVVTVSNTTLDVELDGAPDSNNYELDYHILSSGEIRQILNFRTVLMQGLPQQNGALGPLDLIPCVRMSPVPAGKVIPFGLLASSFLRFKEVPENATAAGDHGDAAVGRRSGEEADYLWLKGPTSWLRVPVVTDNDWSAQYRVLASRQGISDLATDQVVQSFVFAPAFADGSTLRVVGLHVVDTTAEAEKQIITANVLSLTTSGFSVGLSGLPAHAGVKLHWRFEAVV